MQEKAKVPRCSQGERRRRRETGRNDTRKHFTSLAHEGRRKSTFDEGVEKEEVCDKSRRSPIPPPLASMFVLQTRILRS